MKKAFKVKFVKPELKPGKDNLMDLLLLIVLFLILEFEYYDFVNLPFFQEKMGFDFAFSFPKYLIGKLMLAFVLYINSKMKDISYFANTAFLIFLTFPTIIIYQFMPFTTIIISLSAVLFHIIYFTISQFDLNFGEAEILKIKKKHKLWVMIGITGIAIFPLFLHFGFNLNFKAFNPYKIYEIRALSANRTHGISNYFYSWLIKIIIPIGLIMSIKNRKWIWVFIFFLLQIYLFLTEAHKSAFISLFVLLVMIIKSFRQQTRWMLITVIFMVIVSRIISITTNDIMLESIVVRRTFFLPAIISIDYFDFFAHNHTYLSHSIFRHFIDYPFDLDPPHLIGREYFFNPKANANSGFISDGFMNFGYIGIFLYITAMALVLKTVEVFRISPACSGIIIIIIYTFISSFFLTTLLSHGVILFLILAFFLLRNTNDIST